MGTLQHRKFGSDSTEGTAGELPTVGVGGSEDLAGGSGGAGGTSSTDLSRGSPTERFDDPSAPHEVAGQWTFVAASDLPNLTGPELASPNCPIAMSPAVVPGTVLTSLIANGVYPDPLYRHIVTRTVPDTLKDTDYWFRTTFVTPQLDPGERLWLRFDGVNYMAEIWLNGQFVGRIEGAFKQGCFDVTGLVATDGGAAYLAVRVIQLDYSEGPSLPNYASGGTRGGRNGGPGSDGITLRNGPTFFCTAGWDWLPTIPDRNLGIWQPVSWFKTGAVRIADLRVDSTLSDDLRSAELRLDLSLDNGAGAPLTATVTVEINDVIAPPRAITIPAADAPAKVTLTPADIPDLALSNPELWWPNGYGDPHLYSVKVSVELAGQASDTRTVNVGLRRISYSREIGFGAQLAITVNNLQILVMGGNWGLDEALKRIPRERLFNQVRLHRDANLNLIRNWCGQSTSADFFDACDAYGILVWQDFSFSSTEGPPPENVKRYLDNVRDVIVRYRNHPCILLWCGGNEGSPPPVLVSGLDELVKELDPKRLCLTSSAGDTGEGAVNGYRSGGPYDWKAPRAAFERSYGTTLEVLENGNWKPQVPFHNEVGSHSVPTLEFVESMLPESSWEVPDDFWADRDINSNRGYMAAICMRYGCIQNLADFVRKAQMMNYECIKSIFEANAAVMIGPQGCRITSPATGVVMWMTNPAQPSFVWQMYSHDLEQHASFFAVSRACRRVNVILDASNFQVTVANHTAAPVSGSVEMRVYNRDGSLSAETQRTVDCVARTSHLIVGDLKAEIGAATSDVCIVTLVLRNTSGATVVENLYWCTKNGKDECYGDLAEMPPAAVAVSASVAPADAKETTRFRVSVENIGKTIALMTHLQLFDRSSGQRILPAFYSDNYLNLVPGAAPVAVTIDVPHKDGKPISGAGLRIDGWKLDVDNSRLADGEVPVSFNERALAVAPKNKTFHVPCGHDCREDAVDG
jgi:mannosylglycoprotein endo-beta-mannosidase